MDPVHSSSQRKRTTLSAVTDRLMNRMSPSLKIPRIDPESIVVTSGNKEVAATTLDHITNGNGIYTSPYTVDDLEKDDHCNFKRLGARDRKKTDFFTPESYSDDSRPGSLQRSHQKRSRAKSAPESARRALNFDQTNLPCVSSLTNNADMEATEPPSIDLKDNNNNVKEEVHTKEMMAVQQQAPTITKVKPFPIGSLVWGKLPGYDWWPGCVISYDKKEIEKFKDELSEEGTEEDVPPAMTAGEEGEDEDVVAWVKWYGDNQLSLLACRKLKDFGSFIEYFCPSKCKGLYKRAIFASLKEAAKRCRIDALFKNEDKQLVWKFHTQTYNTLFKKNITAAGALQQQDQDQDGNGGTNSKDQVGESSTETLSSDDLFTSVKEVGSPVAGQTSNNTVSTSTKKKTGKERGITLTGIEKELLEWAVKGFRPSGAKGFAPRPEFVQDVQIVPLDPKSEHDTTYDPSTTNGGRVKKDGGNDTGGGGGGRRGIARGSEMDRNKLMIIETRNKAQFELVAQGQIDIEDICLGCGLSSIVAKHPLFHGGLCTYCKDIFMECAYLFDEDGTQMYCTICSAGNEVFMCDTPNCSKVYCGICIEKLCGKDELTAVSEADKWQCYMCTGSEEGPTVRLMKLRENWDKELHDLFINDNEMEFEPPRFYPPICAEDRKPIRVLGLFDGIGTGLLVLKELGIEVELYVSSEIDPDAIKVSRVNHGEMRHVGAIEYITEKEVKAWGPFDLVIGGSPCNDLSIVNPARKGIYDGTGRLFFEFYRILNYAKPAPDDPRPFFWMFENVVSMRAVDKQIISRFLQCNPVIVDARDISAAHRARFFWGNLPGMNRPTVPLPSDRLTLQSCLEPNCFRTAQVQFLKLRTVTTKMNSIKQTKKALPPVKVIGEEGLGEEDEDVLWCSEMERLFGFPVHYTDVANLGRCGRQRLLGKAWSVPVARHLLSPLKDYFKSRTTGTPSSVKFGSLADEATPSPTTTNVVAAVVELTPPPSKVEPAELSRVEDMVPLDIEVSTNANCSGIGVSVANQSI